MRYIVTFKKNEYLKFDNLDNIKGLNHIEYIFEKELHETIDNTDFNGRPIKHYNYRYKIINSDGSKRDIKIGKFDLIDIGVDTRYFRTFKGREISLFDIKEKTLRKFVSMIEDESFIIKDLIPTFNILRLVNSWELYLRLTETKALEDKLKKITTELEKKNETIDKLRKEIASFQKPSDE